MKIIIPLVIMTLVIGCNNNNSTNIKNINNNSNNNKKICSN